MKPGELVKACGGALHDGKAAKLVSLSERGDVDRMREVLAGLPEIVRVKAGKALGLERPKPKAKASKKAKGEG